MKRKKWTEEEEEALIREYSELARSGALVRLKTRERKFQPIAECVNALYHLRDPAAFPFLWSWRDVSIKIQNMRHQFLGVKQKIRLPVPRPSSSCTPLSNDAPCFFDWASGEHYWPNFLRYKQVFGDIDIDSAPSSSSRSDNRDESEVGGEGEEEDDDDDEEKECDDYIDGVMEGIADIVGEATTKGGRKTSPFYVSRLGRGREAKVGISTAKRVLDLGQVSLRREEGRRERKRKEDEEREARAHRREEREHQREVEEAEASHEKRWRWTEEEREWWRRREERWEEEEMEWRARMLGMQIEHEKQVMQMHAEACQAQTQMLGILVRFVCQFLGSAGGGDPGLGGLPHQVLHNLQQQQQHHQQQEQGSIGGENGKSDTSSAGHYM